MLTRRRTARQRNFSLNLKMQLIYETCIRSNASGNGPASGGVKLVGRLVMPRGGDNVPVVR